MSGQAFVPDETAAAVVKKFGYTQIISREVALDHGLIEPTPEEEIAREEAREQHEIRQAQRERVLSRARVKLRAVSHRASRDVLALHAETVDRYPYCEECSRIAGDYEDWPCLTVRTIAAAHEIEVPS